MSYEFTGRITAPTPESLRKAMGQTILRGGDEFAGLALVLEPDQPDIRPKGYTCPVQVCFYPTTSTRYKNATSVYGYAEIAEQGGGADTGPLRPGWLTIVFGHEQDGDTHFRLTIVDESVRPELPAGA